MVSPSFALRLAAAAPCDVRTAQAFLAGRSVRGHLLAERLRRAASELGLSPYGAPVDPYNAPANDPAPAMAISSAPRVKA